MSPKFLKFSFLAENSELSRPKSFKLRDRSVLIPADFDQHEIAVLEHFFLRRYSQNKLFEQKTTQNINYSIEVESTDRRERKDLPGLESFLSFGVFVQIRSGVKDEVNNDLSLLSGRIFDFYQNGNENIFFIHWSSQALSTLPETYFKNAINNNEPISGIYIASHMLIPSSFSEFDNLRNEHLRKTYLSYANDEVNTFWDQVLIPKSGTNLMMSTIWEHFFSNLFAEIKIKNLNAGKKSSFVQMETCGSDEKFGVWVTSTEDDQIVKIIPLADMAENLSHPDLSTPIRFYLDWYNRICPL